MFISFSLINIIVLIGFVFLLIIMSLILSRMCFYRLNKYYNQTNVINYKKDVVYIILAGIIIGMFFVLRPKNDLIQNKYIFIDINNYEYDELLITPENKELDIPINRMETKNMDDPKQGFPIVNNILLMIQNGIIGTPFIQFELGEYRIELSAFGASAENENPKIIIALLLLDKKRLFLKENYGIIELNGKKKQFMFNFIKEKTNIGKIRIQFINNKTIKQNQERNVYIESLRIKKIK